MILKILILFLLTFFSFAEELPNNILTPGEVRNPSTPLKILCIPNFTSGEYKGERVRNVPIEMKKKVFELYGINWKDKDKYEIDHKIPLSIDGENSVNNLWPQSWEGNYNAYIKDKLEKKLRKLVCTNKISLKQAQKEINSDWIKTYHKYVE